MKRFLTAVMAVVCLVLSAVCFVACNTVEGGIKKDGTVVIGATSVPHAEILNYAKDILLKEYNIKIEVSVVDQWALLNQSTVDGDYYANYFQHGIYLEEFNSEQPEGKKLVSLGPVHVEPLGIYSNKENVNLKGGNLKIAITNDVTNQTRALKLLEAQGIITLKTSAENKENVTVKDYEWGTNTCSEVNADLLAGLLPDVDIAVIPGNYALTAELEEAIVTESSDVTAQYANVIAVREGEENSDISKALIEVLQSDKVKEFIKNTYGDAVHAVNA